VEIAIELTICQNFACAGIRTDPFGPPGVHPGGPMGGMGGFPGMGRQRPRDFPDNDIFRPPGGDDMFM
jgi:hypothetical protein